MITKVHHYFLLNPSNYPFLNSLSAFNFLFSLILFLKFMENWCIFLSLLFIFTSMFLWWIDYSKEFNLLGSSTLDLQMGVKTSMILFISSEIFFFFSFFWSYFHFFLSPSLEGGFMWPLNSVQSFEAENIPFLNTVILLSSGILVTISHYYLNVGKKALSNAYLFKTFLLGMVFTICQLQEYSSSYFTLSDGNFGSAFFMLTGFHGVHVLIGSLFLFSALKFNYSFAASKSSFLSFELACWYWHFVDVVWIFLFFLLYYINN